MIKNTIITTVCLIIIFCFVNQNTYCDNNEKVGNYPEEFIPVTGSNYIDYKYFNNYIWAIAANGKLIAWDMNGNILETNKYNLQGLSSIQIDSDGGIFIGSIEGVIQKYDKKEDKFKHLKSLQSEIYSINKIKANKIYAITKNGIHDINHGKLYSFPKSLNSQKNENNKSINSVFIDKRPSTILQDSNNNIWIGYNYGEWGGDIYIFSTTENRYKKIIFNTPKIISKALKFPIIDILPVQSIFESEDNSVFMTSGLTHFGHSGSILKFVEKKGKYIGNFLLSTMLQTKNKEGMIGPGTYNKFNKKVFFFSNNGFRYMENINNIDSMKTYYRPNIDWGGCTNNSCFKTGVTKFEFINKDLLLFLTRKNGIGIFDGNQTKYYK